MKFFFFTSFCKWEYNCNLYTNSFQFKAQSYHWTEHWTLFPAIFYLLFVGDQKRLITRISFDCTVIRCCSHWIYFNVVVLLALVTIISYRYIYMEKLKVLRINKRNGSYIINNVCGLVFHFLCSFLLCRWRKLLEKYRIIINRMKRIKLTDVKYSFGNYYHEMIVRIL